jgi:hypothetical protein
VGDPGGSQCADYVSGCVVDVLCGEGGVVHEEEVDIGDYDR